MLYRNLTYIISQLQDSDIIIIATVLLETMVIVCCEIYIIIFPLDGEVYYKREINDKYIIGIRKSFFNIYTFARHIVVSKECYENYEIHDFLDMRDGINE